MLILAEYIGTEIAGKKVYHPEKFLNDNLPIVICALQAEPLIYKQIKEISVDASNKKDDFIIKKNEK